MSTDTPLFFIKTLEAGSPYALFLSLRAESGTGYLLIWGTGTCSSDETAHIVFAPAIDSLPAEVVQSGDPHGPCPPPEPSANTASGLISQSRTPFADTLTVVRRHLWTLQNTPTPPAYVGSFPSSAVFLVMLIEVACYAA